MRIASERKVKQVLHSVLGAARRHIVRRDIAPEYLSDLDVEQMRRVQIRDC